MQQRYLGLLALALVACGPTYGGQDVKTPDEIVAEQEQLGGQQLKTERTEENSETVVGLTDDEKRHEWDEKQSSLELRRASRSAETCPDSVSEQDADSKKKAKREGVAMLNMTFANDGHVKTLVVSPPYDANAIGKCVQRAMNAIVVPAFKGDEHVVEWQIDFSDSKKSGPVGGDKPASDSGK